MLIQGKMVTFSFNIFINCVKLIMKVFIYFKRL